MSGLVNIKGIIFNLETITSIQNINSRVMESPFGLVTKAGVAVTFINGTNKVYSGLSTSDFSEIKIG